MARVGRSTAGQLQPRNRRTRKRFSAGSTDIRQRHFTATHSAR